MAEGGTPNLDNLEIYAENLQDQEDEILALESIFEGDEGRLEILSRADMSGNRKEEDVYECSGNMLKIRIPVKQFEKNLHIDVYLPMEEEPLANGIQPSAGKFARSDSGHRLIWSFVVTYLPPLCLHVTLPPTYPSRDSPSFLLSCLWLSPHQLTYLCQRLDTLWQDMVEGGGPGMPILYTWVDWLQENLLSCLGIESHLLVSTHVIDEDIDDCRVVMETDDVNDIVTKIMRYNRDRELQEFYNNNQECGICFDELPGCKFFLLVQCKHHVCRDCMTAHCQMIVKEGTVQNLRCPSHECKESIPEFLLRDVLTEEQFQRYQALSLQKALDTMGDVTWCPRCNSAVVQEPERELSLAHCLSCFYSFCTDCEEAWHQGEKCRSILEEDEHEKLRKLENISEIKAAMASKERHKENRMSYDYVNKNASKCPSCNAKIMKTGGCNKVTCTNCGSCMCWICKIRIQGYSHFTEANCVTFTMMPDVDNTDFGDQPHGYYMHVYRPRPPPRPKPKVNEVELRLKEHPELVPMAVRCVACKQRNIKEGKPNHIVCWNCRANLCFQCKQRITGPVGKHYSGTNTCDQHS